MVLMTMAMITDTVVHKTCMIASCITQKLIRTTGEVPTPGM